MNAGVFKDNHGILNLYYCPECGEFNTSQYVSEGVCGHCGYEATEDDIINGLEEEICSED